MHIAMILYIGILNTLHHVSMNIPSGMAVRGESCLAGHLITIARVSSTATIEVLGNVGHS